MNKKAEFWNAFADFLKKWEVYILASGDWVRVCNPPNDISELMGAVNWGFCVEMAECYEPDATTPTCHDMGFTLESYVPDWQMRGFIEQDFHPASQYRHVGLTIGDISDQSINYAVQ